MDSLIWDEDVWLEAMIHITRCERNDCLLCLAIAAQCQKESLKMEDLLQHCA